jgi:hypothetical protein
MLTPASDKVLAFNVSAGEALQQGTVLRFVPLPEDSGRLQAFKVASGTADFDFGTFLAYWIPSDSQDIELVGAPQSSTFTLNTGTGIGGGTNVIASGTEFVALGGSKSALVRLDKHSYHGSPATLPQATTKLKVNNTSKLLDASGDITVNAGYVVQNDGPTIVVLLA